MAIDDSRVVQEFIGLVVGLAQDIVVVAKADTGAQALAQLERMPIDVVTLDMELPDIKGRDLLDRIVAEGQTGIVIVSGGMGSDIHCRYPHIASFSKQDLFDERAKFLAAIRNASHRAGRPFREAARRPMR